MGFDDKDRTIGKCDMEVLLGRVQEAICRSHLLEQYETSFII